MSSDVHKREEGRGTSVGDYWPLFCLIVVTLLAAFALAAGFGEIAMRTVMHGYMGIFLVIFALLKLFDLEGFTDGFHMYDLLAKRVRSWGYVYPFVELALGLGFLAFVAPVAIYIATIVVFLFGSAGVLLALRQGLDIDCPCMGSILSVPLSTVSLTEDLGMAAMAAILLVAL